MNSAKDRVSDKAMPVVTITLDKERHLLFGLRAMKLIEKTTGKNVLSGEFWSNPSAADFSIMLWACLWHEDKDITIEQVDELVDKYSSVTEISEAIAKAWGNATPESDEKAGKESRPLG
ncbi:MAG: hypothetical protein PHQ43_11425 [Dehalococcoidales bacterium]|nr:hypothetical protein [Dehalococcoidales bacterium]